MRRDFLPGSWILLGCTFWVCAPGGAAGAPPAAANRMRVEHAPTPYSAAEIREGCPAGRVNVYDYEMNGRLVRTRSRFLEEADGKARYSTVVVDAENQPLGEERVETAGWEELQGHASFPAAGTVITEEVLELPAGKFICWRYEVTGQTEGAEPKRQVMRLWFAQDLPGPPVQMVQEVDGEVKLRMMLVAVERRKATR